MGMYYVQVQYLVYVENGGYVQCTCTIPSICRGWWVCTVRFFHPEISEILSQGQR